MAYIECASEAECMLFSKSQPPGTMTYLNPHFGLHYYYDENTSGGTLTALFIAEMSGGTIEKETIFDITLQYQSLNWNYKYLDLTKVALFSNANMESWKVC